METGGKGARKINKSNESEPVQGSKQKQIDSPERNIDVNLSHKTIVRVIYADTDAMQVVYHSNYFKWFEVGRTELLRNISYPYERLEREGFMLPVVDCGCKYIQPAIYDDILEITTTIEEIKAATIIIKYGIHRKNTGERIVTGFTKHAVTNKAFKPVRLRNAAPELYNLIAGNLKSRQI